jgi:diguanylate cyclase (GGDEF)-like protein
VTLRRQLFSGLSVIFLLVFICLLVITVRASRSYLQQQLASHAQDAATALSYPLAQSLANNDLALAETQIATVFDRGYFKQVIVLSASGSQLLAKELPQRIEKVPLWFSTLFPLETQAGEAFLTSGWKQLGKVVITSQPTIAYQYLWRITTEMFWWIFGLYFLSLLATRILLRIILEPLQNIENAALAIREKRFVQIAQIPKARELERVVVAMNDMSKRISEILDAEVARAEGFRREAYEDVVTRLENRRSFDLRLTHILEDGEHFTNGMVLMLEINGLKELNTEQGYLAGNKLLSRLAQSAREVLGDRSIILARIGGAAFAFVCLDISASEGKTLTESLRACADNDIVRDKTCASLSFHLGAAHFHYGDTRTQILARADLALESARQSGSNNMEIVGDDHDSSSLGATGWRMMLQKAVTEGRWVLYAQRVVALADQSVMHHEILSRMVDAQGDLVPASYFLPMALRHNLMAEVERVLINLTLNRLNDPQAQIQRVAINIHAQCIKDNDFVRWLDAQLKEHSPRTNQLMFEMSEFGCSRDVEATRRFVAMLRSHGAAFGIDHFGLSPHSLNTLRQLPPDYLKLGGGLVQDILHNEDSRQMFKSIMSFAHLLKVPVIATCIESEEQMSLLRENHVAGAQGYLIGMPEPI